MSAFPPLSPAAQNCELEHDTDVRRFDASTFCGADQLVWLAAATSGVAAAKIMTVVAKKSDTTPTLTNLPRGFVDNLGELPRVAGNFIIPPAVPSAHRNHTSRQTGISTDGNANTLGSRAPFLRETGVHLVLFSNPPARRHVPLGTCRLDRPVPSRASGDVHAAMSAPESASPGRPRREGLTEGPSLAERSLKPTVRVDSIVTAMKIKASVIAAPLTA
jgi:hypothetical protein